MEKIGLARAKKSEKFRKAAHTTPEACHAWTI